MFFAVFSNRLQLESEILPKNIASIDLHITVIFAFK